MKAFSITPQLQLFALVLTLLFLTAFPNIASADLGRDLLRCSYQCSRLCVSAIEEGKALIKDAETSCDSDSSEQNVCLDKLLGLGHSLYNAKEACDATRSQGGIACLEPLLRHNHSLYNATQTCKKIGSEVGISCLVKLLNRNVSLYNATETCVKVKSQSNLECLEILLNRGESLYNASQACL